MQLALSSSHCLMQVFCPSRPFRPAVAPKSELRNASQTNSCPEGAGPKVLGHQQRIVEIGERCPGETVPLAQDQLEGAGQRALDRGAAQLRISLTGMRIADREKGTRDRYRIVHHGTLADPTIIDIAAEIAGWDRIDELRLLWRQRDDTEMRSHGMRTSLRMPCFSSIRARSTGTPG